MCVKTQILKTNQAPYEKPHQALTLRVFITSAFYAMNQQQSNCTWLRRYRCTRKLDRLQMNCSMIANLSEGDLVATESKYHKTCLAKLYNKVRTFASKVSTAEQEISIV